MGAYRWAYSYWYLFFLWTRCVRQVALYNPAVHLPWARSNVWRANVRRDHSHTAACDGWAVGAGSGSSVWQGPR